MKKTKRFICALLSVLMITTMFTALSFTVNAAEDVYAITGDSVWLDGWNPKPTENVMTKRSDGTYAVTVKDVLPDDDNYQLQVVKFVGGNVNSKVWYGANGTTYNYDFRVTAQCDVTVTFDPSSRVIAATGKGVAEAEYPIDKLVAVGSGKDGFLNNVSWGLNAAANEMKMIKKDVYQLVCDAVKPNQKYQLKFAANGTWAMNWGYDGAAPVKLGEPNPALYNSPTNIEFTPSSTKAYVKLTITLDLSAWDKLTKSGATWTIKVEDAVQPVTTQPVTTQPVTVKPTEKPTEAPTTLPPEPTEAPTTLPVVWDSLTVNATSNIAPKVTETFDYSTKQLTVTWWINLTADTMVNTQFEITYDKNVLARDMTPGVNFVEEGEGDPDQKFLILRVGDGKGSVVNIDPKSMPNGGIKGNASNINGWKLTDNGGKVPFVSVTFVPKAGGETNVNLNVRFMQLGNLERVPYYLFKDSRLVRAGITYRPTVRPAAVYAGPFKDDEPEPTTVAPTTAKPTVQPTTAKPTVQPTTAKPTVQPTTAKPTVQPTTAEPTEQPTTAKPTVQPTTAEPTEQPTTAPVPTTQPVTVHVHTPVPDPGKPATFEESGLTEGSHCSECGEVLKPQEIIPALRYEEQTVDGVTVIAQNDAQLMVRKVYDASVLSRIILPDDEEIGTVYEIALIKDGVAIDPIKEVTVKIPCIDDRTKVCLLGNRTSLTDMNAAWKDDTLTFTTLKLGYFVLSAPEQKLGDVNRDGRIDIVDVTLVQSFIAEINTPTKVQLSLGDVDGTDGVNIMDATIIQQYIAEKIRRFPADKS